MQVKKADMEETIICCARDEFVLHGYEASSMRTIAKKANTSLGNIYHYFPNKKAILDRILKPKIYELCAFIREHSKAQIDIIDTIQIEEYLDKVDFEEPRLQILLSKEFVIFMETQDKEYATLRDEHMVLFRNHIATHMRFDNANHHFVFIVTKMLVDSIIHMIKCSECVKDKQHDLVELFKMLCRGVAANHIEVTQSNKEKS